MDRYENIIYEYGFLREEINKKMELHNSLLTFTITTVVAILAIALSNDMSSLYLLSYCILIPMSMRIAYYRISMVKLSAYLIVFLEENIDGINWETRDVSLNKDGGKHWNLKFVTMRNYECLLLSIACYALYVINYIEGKKFVFITAIKVIWPLCLVLWELVITKKIIFINHEKERWIKKWKQLKIYENKVAEENENDIPSED